jgi:hypothetical protein
LAQLGLSAAGKRPALAARLAAALSAAAEDEEDPDVESDVEEEDNDAGEPFHEHDTIAARR